ncbi:apolipoprotein N-acyltransferase [Campylobacter fetus]|nr:apolipoprotein N-acyltransferase [Campylobacter fetus]
MKIQSLAWVSFSKNLSTYFTLNFIRNGFEISILISNFIFLSLLELKIFIYIGMISAVIGLYFILKSTKQVWFWSGFFIGMFWFYWISFSLFYYGFWYIIPLGIVGISTIYAFLFLVSGYFSNLILRSIMLMALGYFYPFDFNWFNLELIFVDTIFKPQIWTLGAVLVAIIFYIKFGLKAGFPILIILLFLNLNSKTSPNLLPFNVELVHTNVPQSKKWERSLRSKFIDENLLLIDKAIEKNASLIVFPESAFPLFLDHQPELLDILKQKSNNIAIVAGALGYENNMSYNAAYVLQNGNVQRLDKVVLVPFGEEIPLPEFFKNLINNIFFEGKKDFERATSVSDYEILGVKIRSAICYEASRDELYENSPKFMIAITNNGWFVPSTEPKLQEKLLKYYSFKHKTTIYHSVNGSKSEIITP